MEAMNSTIPPTNTNPLAPGTTDIAANKQLANNDHSTTHATTGAHTATHSKRESIKHALHEIKETLQRDHHHGQDCAKKPQDGKTNPME
jgi:hypothetical protein